MYLSKTIRLSSLTLLALAAAGAHAELVYGISTVDGVAGAGLVSFDSATPASFTTIAGLTGTVAGQSVRAIDFRPANGVLYAVSASTTVTANLAAQLYTVNLTTGVLTPVGSGFTLTGGNSTRVSIDFNPVVDRLRVVTGANGNYRVNPNDGSLVATDTSINPSALIADVAYSNNVVGAATTTLYAYNYSLDTIDIIGGLNGTPSPNTGTRTTIGSVGATVSSLADIGFDISGATGIGYVSLDDEASATFFDEFYTVNLGTGALTLVDDEIGVDLLDISVRIAPVPEPATMAALGLGALALVRRRRK